MKILLLNPDCHADPELDKMAAVLAEKLEKEGFESDIRSFAEDIRGCVYCGKCYRAGRCMIQDEVNDILDQKGGYAGYIVLVKPVYGDISANCRNLMERLLRCNPAGFSLRPVMTVIGGRKKAGKVHSVMNQLYSEANMYLYMTRNHNVFDMDDPDWEKNLSVMIQGFCFLTKSLLNAGEIRQEYSMAIAGKTTSFLR